MKPNGNGRDHDPPMPVEVEPSETTLALIEQRDALSERIAVEQQRDVGRAELVVWLRAHPQLERRDLLRVSETVFGRQRGKAPAKTRMRIGFTEPKGVKGKVGRAIADGRKAKNLSRSQLASLLHTSNGSVHHWESGTHTPTPVMRARLAKALGMSPDRFTAAD